MRYLLSIILLLSFGIDSVGQTKTLEIPIDNNGDTTFWYRILQKKIGHIGLSELTKSKDSLHFRISTETQVIEIWTSDFKVFNGVFTNFATSYCRKNYKRKHPKPDKYYINQTVLDSAKARHVFNVFDSLSVFSIPTEDSIEGWLGGFDGITYIIECTTPSKYTFKSYWSPHYYKNEIKEAYIIDSLVKHLESTLSMRASFEVFISTLPSGCYSVGGAMVTCRQKTKKHKRRNK